MRTSTRGVELIKAFEGCRLVAYEDVVGVWTIGYGHTGPDVTPGMKITAAQAVFMLLGDLKGFEKGVQTACAKRNPTQSQFDAMVCFAYNVGLGGFGKSSVLKNFLKGDDQSAARSFGLWNKAGGKVWPGLVRRRAAEAALYLEDVSVAEDVEMPQAVEPERSMMKSEIAVGGTVTAAASTISLASQVTKDVSDIAETLGPLLTYAVFAAAAIGLVAGVYVVVMRLKQREGGWS